MKLFSFSYQHDSMQCGIACLQMICSSLGKNYSAEELSHICYASAEGVSLLGISQAADTLGLHTICGRVKMEQLAQVQLPCILHWNQNHFVVLYDIKKKKRGIIYRIADPAKGLLEYSREEMTEHWVSTRSAGEDKGIAMLITPTPAFEQKNPVMKGDTRSFRFIFGYIRQYKKYFGQILIGLALGCLLQLIFPFLTQAIVDVGIKNQDIGFILF